MLNCFIFPPIPFQIPGTSDTLNDAFYFHPTPFNHLPPHQYIILPFQLHLNHPHPYQCISILPHPFSVIYLPLIVMNAFYSKPLLLLNHPPTQISYSHLLLHHPYSPHPTYSISPYILYPYLLLCTKKRK